MKILITGGTGFIGRTLCHRLLDLEHELIVLSRRPEQVSKLCGEPATAILNLEDVSPDESIDAI
ncbi:MAG: NAD-dependent epimerase/dehydratase family protein, partial [Proteobacteria bacterium]|nr:NAD-dependent epimerase/dehydratase family protein [Pseudomonadota bacterium]